MFRKQVAILDIGSKAMRILIAERGVNHTFNILGSGEAEYSGYSNGQFINSDELKYVIGLAKSNAENCCNMSIKELYIGVPAEFQAISLKEVHRSYARRVKINDEMIDDLLSRAPDETYNKDYTLLSATPIYYVLADNRRVICAKKEKTTRLSALISCLYADNNFICALNAAISELGVEYVEYVSSSLCEAQYLTAHADKNQFAFIVDVGYISTSVALIRGNGLLMQQSFSYGGGHIEADLSEYLGIPFASAENLKNKVVLSVVPDKNDVYEIKVGEKVVPINALLANQVVSHRVEFIARAINKCLVLCKEEYPEFINISLTGGGLSYIKGAKDFLAKSLGRNVDLLVPKDPERNKPHLSCGLGLLDYALKKNEIKKPRFLAFNRK